MTLRWLALLCSGLLLMALSAAFYLWSEQRFSDSLSDSRQARVKLQAVEQASRVLERYASIADDHLFAQTIEDLQIDVAQMFTEPVVLADLEVSSFEQSISESTIQSPYGQLINRLRVSVVMSVAHSVSLLQGLQYFAATVNPWPVDMRSCDMSRSHERLNVRCEIEIYHWTDE